MNTPANWQTMEAAIDAVLDLPAGQREAELRRRLCDHPHLLEQALSWSAALDSSEHFLERQAKPCRSLFHLTAGDSVGQWQVEQAIARGGSSEVYRVQRSGVEYHQLGALKLLSNATLGRQFRRERQMLARLQHPNIAHFLDGGHTQEGHAYTVVEYIGGEDLSQWCRERNPDLQQRLQLFVKLCDAVTHAHGHLIVHRDIKPANIRLTPEGEPKLLDFGIAWLVENTSDSEITQNLFTPSYAAPEQLERQPVSVQTDVYGLGGLLHYLLTHRAPWGLDQASLPQAIETILEGRPVQLLDARFDAQRPLNKAQLQGDLEAIVQMAMALQPAQRYPNVAALKTDVQAYLGHFPVRARGQQRSYQLSRFLRRNLWQCVAASVLFIALLSGLLGTLHNNRVIASERDAAVRSAERAHAVRGQLLQLLRSSSGQVDEEERLRLFERSVDDIRQRYADEPAEAARLLAGFGQLYFLANDYVRAEPLLREALELAARSQLAATSQAETQLDLAQVLFRIGQTQESAELLASAQASLQSEPDRFRQDLIESRNLEAQLLRAAGHADQALQVLQAAYQEILPYAGEYSSPSAVLITNLATAYAHAGQLPQALDHFEQGWAMWQSSGQTRTPDALNLLNNWGLTALRAGQLDQSRKRLEQAHALRVALFGDSAALAALKKNLAEALWHSGETDQAIELALSAETLAAQYTGQYSPLHLGIGSFLSEFLYKLGRYDQALNALARCWDQGGEAPAIYAARAMSLQEAAQAGHQQRAPLTQPFEQARALLQGQDARADIVRPFIDEIQALALQQAGQDAAAVTFWRRAWQARQQQQGQTHWQTLKVKSQLDRALSTAGMSAKQENAY